MTDSAGRRRIIPLWTVYTAAGIALVTVGLVVFFALRSRGELVRVPSVTGLDVSVARSRLGQSGLLLRTGDRRFSPNSPVDSVLEQAPGSGALAARGTYVTVVLSAGSEAFQMPDVVGMPMDSARSLLQDKGLVVHVEVVVSERPKDIVVASTPAAGATVTTADTVRLVVSAGSEGSSTLQPANLAGVSFVIDPVPVSAGVTDTPMEIQRRLRSLLEASGATVTVTRSIVETLAPDGVRAQRAQLASSTAVIVLAVQPSGAGGMAVAVKPSSESSAGAYLGSLQLSQALVGLLQPLGGAGTSVTASDPVLQATQGAGLRLDLGSVKQAKDVKSFADPAWADAVARAVYSSIAKVYGAR